MFIPILIFKPPPPVGAGGGYMFLGHPSVRLCVRDSGGSFMFPRYLQHLLTDFRQTFVTGASWNTDDLITFLGQKVKVQGHTIAAEAHSTRVQLFLVLFFFLISSYEPVQDRWTDGWARCAVQPIGWPHNNSSI